MSPPATCLPVTRYRDIDACDVIVLVDKIDPRVPQVYSFANVSKTAYAGDSMFKMYMGPRHEL